MLPSSWEGGGRSVSEERDGLFGDVLEREHFPSDVKFCRSFTTYMYIRIYQPSRILLDYPAKLPLIPVSWFSALMSCIFQGCTLASVMRLTCTQWA